MDIYNDLDLHFNDLKNVGNWPQDLIDAKLQHANLTDEQNPVLPSYINTEAESGSENIWDTNGVWRWQDIDEYVAVTPEGAENPQTQGWYERSLSEPYTYSLTEDEEVVNEKTYYLRQWGEEFAALCYAYKTRTETDGVYGVKVVAVPIASSLSAALYGNGLTVDENTNVVSVKVDSQSESYVDNNNQSTPFLSVGPNGVKLQGLNAKLAALASSISGSWEHIMVGKSVTSNKNIGNVTGASDTTAIEIFEDDTERDHSLKELFDALFKAKAKTFTIINPTLNISFKTPVGVNEDKNDWIIGDTISNITCIINPTTGVYPYGSIDGNGNKNTSKAGKEDTGVEWKQWKEESNVVSLGVDNNYKKYKITSGFVNNQPVTSNNDEISLTLVNPYVVGVTSDAVDGANTVKITITGVYSDATKNALNNLNADSDRKIKNDNNSGFTKLSIEDVIFSKTVYYPSYYGFSRYNDINDAQKVIDDFERLGDNDENRSSRTNLTRDLTTNGKIPQKSQLNFSTDDYGALVYEPTENDTNSYAETNKVRFWIITKVELTKVQSAAGDMLAGFEKKTISLNRNGYSMGNYYVYLLKNNIDNALPNFKIAEIS